MRVAKDSTRHPRSALSEAASTPPLKTITDEGQARAPWDILPERWGAAPIHATTSTASDLM